MAYGALFRHRPDQDVLTQMQMATHQNQPLGSTRFLDTIERVTGQRREPKPRGRRR